MIELTDGWVIQADSYQLILGLQTTQIDKKTGKEVMTLERQTYHGDLGHALLEFYKTQLRDGITRDKYTLESAMQFSKEIERRILTLVEEPKTESFNTVKIKV